MELERLGDFLHGSYGRQNLSVIQQAYLLTEQIRKRFKQEVRVVLKGGRVKIYCPDSTCAYALNMKKKKLHLLVEEVLRKAVGERDVAVLVGD